MASPSGPVPPPSASSAPASSAAPLPPPREPGAPYRVCLVCLGNICRSPMAETVLRAFLVKVGLDDAVSLDSAGTADWNIGRPMDPQALATLASRGYDGSGHRARQFRASWLVQRDLVLAMDADNLAALRRMAPAADSDRIRLFGEVGGLVQTDGEIPDPYGGNAAESGYVLDLISTAAPVIIARLAGLLEPANPASVSRASVSGASGDVVSEAPGAGRRSPDCPGAPA